MRNKRINAMLGIGLTGVFIFGSSFFVDLYRAFWGNETIWWTAQTQRLPVEATRGSVELYINGKLLQKHLADGTLLVVDANGTPSPVATDAVGVRLNNWDKVKAGILTSTTMTGFGFGVAVTLLVIGAVQSFANNTKKLG
jgi:hypothetical protein